VRKRQEGTGGTREKSQTLSDLGLPYCYSTRIEICLQP
jgi:hypothetical protein